MRVAMIAIVSALALCSPFVFATTARHEHAAGHYFYRDAGRSVFLHPNYGNPNGTADGPTTLSGTGDSAFGGSSPGTSGHN